MNIIINTVILAAQEIIYRVRKWVELSQYLTQVRRKLYNQMIMENLLAKLLINKQNSHKTLDSNEDDLCKNRVPTD